MMASYTLLSIIFLVYLIELESLTPRLCSRRCLICFGASLAGTAFWNDHCAALAVPSSFPLPDPDTPPLRPGKAAMYRPVIDGDAKPPFSLITKLGRNRLLANELSGLSNQGFSRELYYAPFLFGSWNVKGTLRRKVFPYGTEYLPSKSLLLGSPRNREEQVGDCTQYELHYFSTLPNVATLSADSSGILDTKIIQDRSFNSKSLSKAYNQLAKINNVAWDYDKQPSKVVLGFEDLTDDLRPLGPRRTEVFIAARQSEEANNVFCSAERTRSVTLVPGNVVVSDTETTTEFRRMDDNHVVAASRIAVYLTPNPNSREGVLWESVGGKAVAFYDYELEMERILQDIQVDGETVFRACVQTPKGVVQCL